MSVSKGLMGGLSTALGRIGAPGCVRLTAAGRQRYRDGAGDVAEHGKQSGPSLLSSRGRVKNRRVLIEQAGSRSRRLIVRASTGCGSRHPA